MNAGELLKQGVKGTTRIAKMAASAPLTTASLGLFAGSIAAPAIKSLTEPDQLIEEFKSVKEEQAAAALQRLKFERLQRNMAENAARLAKEDPHLYQEILRGRKLARGTVVFGGRPRNDLMERMAERMSTGVIGQKPMNPDSEIEQLM